MSARAPFDRVPEAHLRQWVRDSSTYPLHLPVTGITLYGYSQHAPGNRNFDVFGELIFLANPKTSIRVASFAEAADWWNRLGYGTLTKDIWREYLDDASGVTKPDTWRTVCVDWFGIDPEENE